MLLKVPKTNFIFGPQSAQNELYVGHQVFHFKLAAARPGPAPPVSQPCQSAASARPSSAQPGLGGGRDRRVPPPSPRQARGRTLPSIPRASSEPLRKWPTDREEIFICLFGVECSADGFLHVTYAFFVFPLCLDNLARFQGRPARTPRQHSSDPHAN